MVVILDDFVNILNRRNAIDLFGMSHSFLLSYFPPANLMNLSFSIINLWWLPWPITPILSLASTIKLSD